MARRAPDIRAKLKAARAVVGGAEATVVASTLGVGPEEVNSWAASFDAAGEARLRKDFPPASSKPSFPRPDPGLRSVAEALAYARPKIRDVSYGGYLSNALAVVMANQLRDVGFDDVLPDERGGFESPARSARGLKKLDVNYSTPEMGLGLGLSIKTISKRDPETNRYTKNYSRNDNELRAEAVDYHRRQPFAVLAGFLYLPVDSADDAGDGPPPGESGVSSFGAAVQYFRHRTPRDQPDEEADLFEAFYIVLYDSDGEDLYWPVHDVDLPPPRGRRPKADEAKTLADAIGDVVDTYERRNNPPFSWSAD